MHHIVRRRGWRSSSQATSPLTVNHGSGTAASAPPIRSGAYDRTAAITGRDDSGTVAMSGRWLKPSKYESENS